ncbi:4'-phosphopantetheinyl transferase superfamily protein [Tahibacter amnicola]|uniref:4'-phosphopantetheinyl transferase superfamily protein n=2 Tax=Tahibacter amnicola TaxID=2976241 RepID=A0ABY6BQ71_9GAMM|nr:4'-phosphopantetheinyl transferase superfamily protein [Tahibacter amnicola]
MLQEEYVTEGFAVPKRTGLQPLPADEVHVWYAWSAEFDTPAFRTAALALLSTEERQRHDRYVFDYLKLEYLVTRALCRGVLSRYAATLPSEWTFVANEYGRPEIAAIHDTGDLRFNLSNSRSLVACLVGREVDAGVDVERCERLTDIAGIAEHHFSPTEVEALFALPESERQNRFFQYWTLKESYIKARGMGLSIPLDQFSFALDGDSIGIGFDPALDDTPAHWQFELHRPDERHQMAVGLRHGGKAPFTVLLRAASVESVLEWITAARDAHDSMASWRHTESR